MPNVPIEFLRGVLGVLCVFFAYMAGRSVIGVRKGRQKPARMYAWILRTFVCAVVLVFRHAVDTIAMVVWALAAGAFAAGAWTMMRQKPPEDLTHEIFQ